MLSMLENYTTDNTQTLGTSARLTREKLERQEGTPRARLLSHIQAAEYGIARMLALALSAPTPERDAEIDQVATTALDRLNDLYLLVSPED